MEEDKGCAEYQRVERRVSDYQNSLMIAENALRRQRFDKAGQLRKTDRLRMLGQVLVATGIAIALTSMALGEYTGSGLGVALIGLGTLAANR